MQNDFHLIETPAKTFVFRGMAVPAALAYEYEDEQDLANAKQVGPGMAQKIAEKNGRKFKGRSWPTREAGEAAAQAFIKSCGKN